MASTAAIRASGKSAITVEPVSGALGAAISGVDLSSVDDSIFAEIHEAFMAHQVLFFHGQSMTPEDYVAFARRFGEPIEYPFAKGLEGYPEITEIIKEPHQTSNFGGMWHSDTTYLQNPPMATMLMCVETPAAGGDTLFASMTKAYDRLSGGMKELLAPLKAVNTSALNAASLRGDHLKSGSMGQGAKIREVLTAEHPVIRTHPVTGQKAIYVNPSHTERFAGMTREESAGLLGFLFTHAVRPEFTCRFRWAPGSVTIWDNRCTWHDAINDYDGHRRVMRRITIAGDAPPV
ncbi:MAG: TauD/TfdA family dioxygenase [Pseudomonadota bacterium]|nr:TauD/TfdA family dioxygenase [Pseudomonadota bacterium]